MTLESRVEYLFIYFNILSKGTDTLSNHNNNKPHAANIKME